jgi:hypothetical protein
MIVLIAFVLVLFTILFGIRVASMVGDEVALEH